MVVSAGAIDLNSGYSRLKLKLLSVNIENRRVGCRPAKSVVFLVRSNAKCISLIVERKLTRAALKVKLDCLFFVRIKF